MKRLFYLSGSLFFLALTLLIGFHLGLALRVREPARSMTRAPPGTRSR